MLALATWGKELTNSVLKIHTDNEALHFVINKQYSKEDLVKTWIRKLVLLSLEFNILLKAYHISGENNFLADHLSRLEVDKFVNLHVSANEQPSAPPNLTNFAQNELSLSL